ncbi:MAG: hypothetical protein WB679_08830 [Terracidiphilus sp.]
MSIAQLVAAAQTNVPQPMPSTQAGHSVLAGYSLFAIVAAVLALVVLIFIRTSARRSKQ